MDKDFDSIELVEAVHVGFRYIKMAKARWASVRQHWVRGQIARRRFAGAVTTVIGERT
jgi:hypothetical protein